MFVTAIFAVYDPDRGTLTWSNAGHPPPRLLRGDSGTCGPLTGERCVPLGIIGGTQYPESEVSLAPEDLVLLHTDGVTEAKNSDDEMFGADRLDAVLTPGRRGARATIGSVLDAMTTFTGGAKPADDYTLLAMKFVQSKKKAGEISGEWRALPG
jgi:sigma-B regulation protein RsbU (phosphoserine phosphatase)